MTTRLGIALKQLPHGEGLPLPSYATDNSAGADVCAAVAEPVTLAPGERKLIPTGLALAIPPGYEVQIRSRSGLTLKQGLVVANGVGTIDADYRGELGVVLINLGTAPAVVERGMRIAQLVTAAVTTAAWEVVNELPATARGEGGFGSTGVASSAA